MVVGASDTGLSCLEALLTGARHRGTHYTHLALVSPTGIACAGGSGGGGGSPPGCCGPYSPGALARLGLGASVSVVEGALVGLDRREKAVLLDSGAVLPYDLLLVTTGLQVGRERGRSGKGPCHCWLGEGAMHSSLAARGGQRPPQCCGDVFAMYG